MEGKKISFSFMKTKKAEKPVVEEKKDFIECVEEKSIKILGGEAVVETAPLVIPMKPNTLITAEKLREIANKVEGSLNEPEEEIKVEIKLEPIENETLDQMAVRELMQDAKKEVKVETQVMTVPVPSKPVMEGQKESTLDDYEAVPVQDFGMAMLRGMGWTPGNEQSKYKQPTLRPKGLGLGADKVVSDNNKKKNATKDNREEELSIVKNSYVKITSGKHNGYYGKGLPLTKDEVMLLINLIEENPVITSRATNATNNHLKDTAWVKLTKKFNTAITSGPRKPEQLRLKWENLKKSARKRSSRASAHIKVVSLDDDNGRVMVELAVKKETVSLSEFMMQPVTKAEFDKESKVINTGAYEEYKKHERSVNQTSAKHASPKLKEREASSSYKSNDGKDRRERDDSRRRDYDNSSNGRNQEKTKHRSRRDSSSSSDKKSGRKKEKSRDDSSDSEDRSRRRKKDKHKRESSSEDRERRKRKDKKKYDSNDSLDSVSDSEKKKKNKNYRRHKDSSDSESDHHKKDKRDIDKKRKGKKKKRDRDRSPNYKKHRK